jgi:hypothetical protein
LSEADPSEKSQQYCLGCRCLQETCFNNQQVTPGVKKAS